VDGIAASVLGIDPVAYPSVSGLTFTSGNADDAYARLARGRYALINAMLATNSGIKAGDSIELTTPTGKQTYEVVAIGTDYLNTKIATVYISHANIEQDFGKQEDVLLQMNLSTGADREAVEDRLTNLLTSYPQFRLVKGQEYITESMKLFNTAFSAIIALGIFLAIPSLIAMVNTLAIGVIERTREIGMLRAVGATRKQIRTIIVAEAIILSSIGTGFGILAGLYLGYMGVEAIRAAGFPMMFSFPVSGTLVAIAAGLIFGALAAVIPARQAARLEIVQALRYE
jgi:putative ABC transport system permease protein